MASRPALVLIVVWDRRVLAPHLSDRSPPNFRIGPMRWIREAHRHDAGEPARIQRDVRSSTGRVSVSSA